MLDTSSPILKKISYFFFPNPRPTGSKMAAKTSPRVGLTTAVLPVGEEALCPLPLPPQRFGCMLKAPQHPLCARGTPVLPFGEDLQPFEVSGGDHARLGPCLPLATWAASKGLLLTFFLTREGNQHVWQLGMSPVLMETAWIRFSPEPQGLQDIPVRKPTGRPGQDSSLGILLNVLQNFLMDLIKLRTSAFSLYACFLVINTTPVQAERD